MGKQQLIVGSVAKALEIIPRQICDNAGLDATDVLNKLRMRHAQGDLWAGVDVETEGVQDNMKKFVWEPALVKTNALSSAIDAACLILSVDETVRNPQSEVSQLPVSCLSQADDIGSTSWTTHAKRCGAAGSARSRKGTRKIDTESCVYIMHVYITNG
jgi:T-complex protein 1 subunit eta